MTGNLLTSPEQKDATRKYPRYTGMAQGMLCRVTVTRLVLAKREAQDAQA